jgi:predicted DNA-binding protein (MmcQ/YjbR family)
VIDQGIGEEYLLLESASSGYASLLREEVEAEAKKIFTECFDLRDRTEEIRKAVRDSFPCTVETPWEEYPDFYVFRRTDSKKWFGLLMKVPYRKLGMEREGKALVLNLKLAPERIQGLIDGKNYLVCYHMNKKEWITVLISPSFPLKTLLSLLKESFALTAKKK